ncbi:MAG: adenosylcobalamin-dependent ribonucleoside-diphosphate reductase [Phycisphaeraceae bacterium]|nr:adenosylcobalamin-dependent ribonucleoside-diphosphate reductase [Phycisphaeraceae bacterium]
MKITRRFTEAGKDVYSSVEWTRRSSRISNPDGSTVFEVNDAEVPKSWSQLATDIMVSKYFRKAGVPQADDKGRPVLDDQGKPVTGPEKSVKQVVHRLAGCWRWWGEKHGYFDSKADAQAFYDELAYMLLNQMAAPNSPQWFNTGLNWAHGINGPAQGHWFTDPKTGETKLAEDAYTHPQPHACFIQSIEDDLVNPGGIMDLWVREARLFKYGSGTGTNFSKLRGEDEPLSGGGKSSGLMSFLKIGDRAAGAIKSGGTTRRAAKMVCLDLDHPDIENFINWKVREEIKVAAMAEGLKHLGREQKETAERLGLKLDYDFNGEAYATASGQNSNNSVRIPNEFFRALDADADWTLVSRTTGKVTRTIKARKLWEEVCYAAWRCADPGVQFDTTINQWHTCPESGRINASNPCSEYMFLDNTACNLASLNLLKFYDRRARKFDLDGFAHAVRLWTVVLEISVLMAAFPSKEIARLSYKFRTLGLGHANLGAVLMQLGVPYDSQRGRAIGAAISAVLTGASYATSAEMAAQLGPFPGYYENRDAMLRVIRNHRRAAYGVPADPNSYPHELDDYEGLDVRPVPLDYKAVEAKGGSGGSGNSGGSWPNLVNAQELLALARTTWDQALSQGEQHGYRNAQTTVIAPTGTIGLQMDCDTTGVEPDFALVKFKKLAGGGYFKIANQSLRPALESLGYGDAQIREILTYVMGALSLDVPLPKSDGTLDAAGTTFADWLKSKGFKQEDLDKINNALGGAMELSFVFNTWTLGSEALQRLNLVDQPDMLKALGLSKLQVEKLNELVCGTGTLEGAPHLAEEQLAVFDCASKCGRKGKRFIAPQGHIRMMAAVQPFITGAISKTINLPHEATVEDIQASYRLSWELGLKANALYRDGCKLSQPLNSVSDADDEAEDTEGVEAGKEEVAAEAVSVASRIATAATEMKASIAGSLPGEPVIVRATVEKVIERILERPLRRRLPDTRHSLTHKFNVAGHEGYLTVGLYEDHTPGELFITMAKEGSTIGGLMDCLGTAISVALQYGVPIESMVNKFTHQRFEPAGMTHNPDIPFAKSLVDYIFRWMGMEFIPGYRAANAPKREKPAESSTDEPRGNTKRTASASTPASIAESGSTAAPAGKGNGNGSDHHHGHDHSHDSKAPTRESRLRAVNPSGTGEEAGSPGVTSGGASGGASGGTSGGTSGGANAILTAAMRELQSDAPACDVCGTITVRNGTCYKCLNCGQSMGCS